MKKVIKEASWLEVVFNRAFDEIKDDFENEFNKLRESGVNVLLTSGFAKTAVEGINWLQKFVKLSIDDINFKILVGSGVDSKNISKLIKETNSLEYHVGKSIR